MTTPSTSGQETPPDSWERIAGELRACKESQKQSWGDLDSSTLGRYLAGEVADDELGLIERELADHPELRQLTDLVRDVLGDLGPITSEPAPTVLSFEKARKQRRVLPFLRRHAALAAVACLLVALGTVVPMGGIVPPGDTVVVARSPDGVSFMGDAVARSSATSPTALFTTVDAPTEIASADPSPPDRPEVTIRSPIREKVFAAKHAFHEGVTEAKKMSSSDAAANDRRGQDELRRGRVCEAEKSLASSYDHYQRNLGANHPITTRTAHDLGNLYALALDEDPSRQPVSAYAPATAPTTAMKFVAVSPYDKREGADQPEATRLRERIARQTIPQLQATVVPVLIRNLESAQTAAQRQMMVLALGNLGPAASPALPALQQSLGNATPAETSAILHTMGRIGPASVPVLNQLSGNEVYRNASKDRANLSARDQEYVSATLRKLQSPEAQAGIADEAACLSFREIRTASLMLHRLAKDKDFRILVLIQTKLANRPEGDRLTRLGKYGVHVAVDLAGNVAVKVSPALERAGFSADAVREAMLDPCKARQFDKACDAAVGLIVEQARKVKSAKEPRTK